ncbi:hypothetical protein GUJ93_ZPchr0006g45133 [Zizania palustris]|uniref:Uncharacterized protein n=1 Tax=Zizania palustris TaxID=103762 RepID=A0A8J5VWB1_ZIZPA|nr:hypothetical protein GUJ93_ZPchr0006g45133 [Zizania palustris]
MSPIALGATRQRGRRRKRYVLETCQCGSALCWRLAQALSIQLGLTQDIFFGLSFCRTCTAFSPRHPAAADVVVVIYPALASRIADADRRGTLGSARDLLPSLGAPTTTC